jgi:hypothetical protein
MFVYPGRKQGNLYRLLAVNSRMVAHTSKSGPAERNNGKSPVD